MKIIIIGGAGFIGTELSAAACSAGHAVASFDIVDSPRPEVEGLANFSYRCIRENDIAENELKSADSVVILAAKRPYADFCFEDYLGNVKVFEKYMTLASACGVGNVVFASSKAVYSGTSFPWSESERAVPSSLYGASKLACEELGLYIAEKYGVGFSALRFAQVIGYGERKGYLISTLIDNAIAKKPQIIFGSGEQRRHYVYVKDVCRAILCAASHPEVRGVFNIGMKNTLSNLEMAESANRVLGNEGNLFHDYSKEMGNRDDEMDTDSAEKVLGFTASYDIDSSFRDIESESKKSK